MTDEISGEKEDPLGDPLIEKLKSKTSEPKKSNTVQKVPVKKNINHKSRDFSTDLDEYLTRWEEREKISGWKFSKVLQSWAIAHLFDKKQVSKELFKKLLPYIDSIQGAAKTRLVQVARDLISKTEEPSKLENINENDVQQVKDIAPKSNVSRRATRVLKVLGEL